MTSQNKTVYIIGPTFGFDKVVPSYGYTPYTDSSINFLTKEPDFVAWMGGVDISPDIYGEDMHQNTQSPNKQRDAREIELWHKYKHLPKWGICRGAQLLNCLNGGKLYQDVDNHAGRNHVVSDYKGRNVVVCSVHHQMMIPPSEGKILAWSHGVSTYRDRYNEGDAGPAKEPEVVFFPEDKALCFQAHPEFGPSSCTDYFFQLVKELY